jgi:heme d1 biosynthesis radical SAM protein NirJ
MFRLTQFMKEVIAPTAGATRRRPTAPVVIWNLIRRCNLVCKHCYSISADTDFAGELSTAEVYSVMDDLRAFGVSVLILSGGEPLLRRDLFDIARLAKRSGFFVALSSNGTLIDDASIDDVAATGFDYVGISLDGIGATHDAFRKRDGAYAASLRALRLCRDRGLKVGVRYTLTVDTAGDLPALLRLVDDEGIDKFYLSHLNYAGRGNRHRCSDVAAITARSAMDLLFETCLAFLEAGREKEFVTGNNDADGVYFLRWVEKRFPDRAGHLRVRLAAWGGNGSGVGVANIDNRGDVHPDTYWWNHSIGNVRDRPFSALWSDPGDRLMAGLRQRPRPLKGRCRDCAFLAICNGNTRSRAFQLTGDPWAEDPGCYLTDTEIGLAGAGEGHCGLVPA